MPGSDTATTSEGKATAWTDEAKFQFLLRIVAQLKENGATINWAKINMPGRTIKSLQNMWTKINKMVADMDAAHADQPNPLMTTPRKRTKKSAAGAAVEGSDGEFGTPATKKRAADGVPAKRSKKPKLEAAELIKAEDEDSDST